MNRTLNGRYRIDGVVGDGGMAVVYRGWDTVLNRVVAIKVLREQYATNDQFLARFRREAQSAAGLSHPNIVNVYDVGRDGDTWYIVQELIDGTDLASMIRKRGQYTVGDAIDVIAQIAPAIDYAHSRGLIHRDIKPHNILIDARGTAKVADFGIAKGVNDVRMTDAGTALGTAGYISPEQATGSPLTAASDLYSVGVLLYEMLTGRLPFVGDTAVNVAMQHVRNAPPPPTRYNAKIPRPVEAVIMRALEKLPERRFVSGADMVAALRGESVPGPIQTVAVAGAGATTRALPEGTRALPLDAPRARAATIAPPRRAEVTPAPRRSRGPGVGTWLLGAVLLGGLLALVYLGYKLANASNAPPPSANGTPTALVANATTNATTTVIATPKASVSAPAGASPSPAVTPTTDPNMLQVPNLLGSYQPRAGEELQKLGLGLGKETRRTNETVPRGQIIEQDPKPGDFAKKGSQITIVTSQGPSIVDLSGLNVKGKGYEDVVKQLTDLGLTADRKDELSPDVDAGRVTRIMPPDKVVHDGAVAVYVSTGKPTPTPAPATATPAATATLAPTPTTAATATAAKPSSPPSRITPAAPAGAVAAVPNVIGKSPDEAKQQLQQAGFTQVDAVALSIGLGNPAKQKKGTVVGIIVAETQTIVSPGQGLPKDTPLVLIVQAND